MKPLLIINFKTYEEATGKNALKLAKVIEKFANSKSVEIILAVQPTDIRLLSENTKLTIFSQHIDPIKFGANTGWILPEAVKYAGARGTLLNHSERRLEDEKLKETIIRCKEIGLRTVVCAETLEKAIKIALLKPDYIAFEPPELIGGDISVSKAKPEIIKKFVEEVKEKLSIPILCGAGVKNEEDVRKAKELGVDGILVASGVVKAKKPEEAVKNLLKGFIQR
jgi:triosephosphate isomerase